MSSVLNDIRKLLKIEVKLDTVNTAKGVVLEAEAFEAGEAIWVLPASSEDERIPVPPGEYELEGGQILVVVEEGIIDSIGEAQAEPEKEEQDMEKEAKKVVETVSKETHFSADQIDELKELFKSFMTELAEEAKEEIEGVKEETKEVEVEAAEVVKPLTHSPEKLVDKKRVIVKANKNLPLKERINKALSDTIWSNN